ncbi:unnamed protein product [Timema podura]|uniref:Uncharacterized protein n=1 Tax=Timema podura TaxID=61482 RepID=A0ABN7PMK1_TIMPD|nr:unnamed protein product [Timema podura]
MQPMSVTWLNTARARTGSVPRTFTRRTATPVGATLGTASPGYAPPSTSSVSRFGDTVAQRVTNSVLSSSILKVLSTAIAE